VNKRVRFEIVRRGFGRFGWIFVKFDDRGRRRVLAASQRSYGSRKGVCKAILALQGADVVDTTKKAQFTLPATSFTLLEKQVPLSVPESADAELVVAREVNCEEVVEDEQPEAAAKVESAAPKESVAASPPTARRAAQRSRASGSRTTRRTAT
jgi:hypothetical protein